MKKLWAGRFSKETDALVNKFNASIEVDKKLYKHDILGSIAHVKMLSKCNIITKEEGLTIIDALENILSDIEQGKIKFNIECEDIHMNIEKILIDKVGEAGKKVHTARSRNDQVAVDVKLYLKEEIKNIQQLIKNLLGTFVNLSEKNIDTIVPGYTHLQRAQPITLAYYFMAYFEMFKRDYERLQDCYERMDYMPLGAGALAGTTYNTDRQYTAELLNFKYVCENSLDAVSDRDFVIEFISNCSITIMHLSRFCEELIIWNSTEFSFVEIDDAYSTGSSIMPQKKNPDIAELIRGKTGRIYGNLITILTIMKALPLAYNKDMQEDKEPLFDTVDTIKTCLEIFNNLILAVKFNEDKMKEACCFGFMNATDAADYLCKKGVPFRTAHKIIGNIIAYCLDHKKSLNDLSLEEFKVFSKEFSQDIAQDIKIENCIEHKTSYGSTSNESVLRMIEKSKKFVLDKLNL